MKHPENCMPEVLISEEKIRSKVREMGKQISDYYLGKKLLLVGVLKGAFVFTADLLREITVPCEIDFISVSSYGGRTQTSGNIKILNEINTNLPGYDVLIAEDILDSGYTLEYIKNIFSQKGAASVRICVLLNKTERRKTDVFPDYEGFLIPDVFVAGYGLDYNEKYRNLPYIVKLNI